MVIYNLLYCLFFSHLVIVNNLYQINHHLDLYLGEYDGYYIWFECYDTEVMGCIEIGNYYFEYTNGFELYAYKDSVVKVIDLYNDGILSDSDIEQIEEYYYYAYDKGII